MILPNNGKVVIIDDVPKDVEDLTDALTREKMPFLFFKDPGLDDLPLTPINNVRLLFLDLELGIGGVGAIEKIRIVQQRMFRIIEPNTPYVLVIWSTHEDVYAQTLFDEFKNGFKEYAPVACCSLDKSEIKKLKEKGENVLNIIRERLRNELSKFSSFNLFLLWESIVNDSCGEAVNNIINSSYKNTETVDVDLKTIVKKLANAYLGRRIIKADSKTIQKSAMFTFNDLFKESIEKGIINSDFIDTLEFSDATHTNINLIAKLNSKLLLETDVNSDTSPGNVYRISPEESVVLNREIKDKTKQSWLENIVLKSEIKKDIDKKIIEKTGNPPEELELNKLVRDLMKNIADESHLIEIEISPICDYAQGKRVLSRTIKGCLFPHGIVIDAFLKSKTDYLFMSPLIEYENKIYKIVIDLRLFSSTYINETVVRKPIFKVRHQLLSEIQINVSKHVSRIGLTFLDERDL